MSRRSVGEGKDKKIDFGKFILAKLKKNKKLAEMVVDPEKAWNALKMINKLRKEKESENQPNVLTIDDLKSISEIDINNVFEGLIVFEDAKKGEAYPNTFLEEMFETSDHVEIAYQFLLNDKTEWNWTKNQRDEFSEQKRRKIINLLARNCTNPQTKKPHPPQRLEKALKESKYNIILNKTAEEQLKDVIHAISPLIPIKMENVELAVKIPAAFAPKAYGTVEKLGNIKQSEWQNDGSWVGILNIPAGLEAEFVESINKLTRGRGQIKVLKRT